jgi:hypothetical protein
MRYVRIAVAAVVIVALGFAGLRLYRWCTMPPELKIKQVIENIRLGIEAGSPGQIMDQISGHYWDGRNTKMDLRRIALQVLESSDQFGVAIDNIEVQPIPHGAKEAKAHINVEIWPKGGGAENSGWTFAVDGTFEKTWRGWKATSFTGWQATVDTESGGGL